MTPMPIRGRRMALREGRRLPKSGDAATGTARTAEFSLPTLRLLPRESAPHSALVGAGFKPARVVASQRYLPDDRAGLKPAPTRFQRCARIPALIPHQESALRPAQAPGRPHWQPPELAQGQYAG